ncbi:hypothetical protein BURKHO8Y_210657 [Burkholderia sp. 8Y]|uniref:hypothetical protein n=1 Tax=Burkholderia sp. 8Y TaxID=2653133 RepID=UPI0012F2CC33|nr:hypothetical protein [Burkholderia sp. 8Y]VXC46297.1 hypothetical protein BURKHO8Y_210657 [Burkholderia sp. 8Y]
MISVGHHGDASLFDETLRERETAPPTRRPLGETAFEGAPGKAFGEVAASVSVGHPGDASFFN